MTTLQFLQSHPFSLKNREARRKFARDLSEFLCFWNYSEMEFFVEEMHGLNLRKVDDQQTFVDFLRHWMPEVP